MELLVLGNAVDNMWTMAAPSNNLTSKNLEVSLPPRQSECSIGLIFLLGAVFLYWTVMEDKDGFHG